MPDPARDPSRRTMLAAERTWLAWWRSAIAAAAAAIAVGGVVPELVEDNRTAYIVLGAGYAVLALVTFVSGALRQVRVERALERGHLRGRRRGLGDGPDRGRRRARAGHARADRPAVVTRGGLPGGRTAGSLEPTTSRQGERGAPATTRRGPMPGLHRNTVRILLAGALLVLVFGALPGLVGAATPRKGKSYVGELSENASRIGKRVVLKVSSSGTGRVRLECGGTRIGVELEVPDRERQVHREEDHRLAARVAPARTLLLARQGQREALPAGGLRRQGRQARAGAGRVGAGALCSEGSNPSARPVTPGKGLGCDQTEDQAAESHQRAQRAETYVPVHVFLLALACRGALGYGFQCAAAGGHPHRHPRYGSASPPSAAGWSAHTRGA